MGIRGHPCYPVLQKTSKSQASVDWCGDGHVWECDGIPGLVCVLAKSFCIVSCRNPWASVASLCALRELLYCKLQESVGIRGFIVCSEMALVL